jgi:glycosyltransferase involved in cell wall biosynthesis
LNRRHRSTLDINQHMKVLIVSSLYGLSGGGAGIIVQHLTRALSAVGSEVALITMGKNRSYSVSEEDGIRVYRFRPDNIYPFEEKDIHPFWQKIPWQILDLYNFHSSRVIHQILEREAPEIVHLHKIRGFSSAVWSITSKLLPGSVIQTCHDYESMSPDGLMRGLVGRMALRRQWPVRGYQLIRARLSNGVSAVTAPSSFTLNRILESGLFPSAVEKVIPNTHGWSKDQLRTYHQNVSGATVNPSRFLFLGRLEAEKGIIDLCEAFKQASSRCPLIRLDIAGWGTLDSELREKYGWYPGINLLGELDGDAKKNALRNATVVVVPSLVHEVFSMSTIEAFAFGKPVIANNVGALSERIRQGETGWLVEPNNVDALAEQLEYVAKIDSSVLNKMSQNCKEFSYEFAVERVLREYLDLYNQILE